MSRASATARFNRIAFADRVQCWPVTVSIAAVTGIAAAKSPTRQTRVPNEQGSGWTQRAQAVFNFAAAGTYTPTLGADFTVTASETASEVGEVYRCFDLRPSNPATGSDHRCVCFRLD